MSAPLFLGQLVVATALAGLIWTVQLAVYPHFAGLVSRGGADAFRVYHAAYMKSMGYVAGPLMIADLGFAGASLLAVPGDPMTRVGALLVGLTWAHTFGQMVPLHRRLQRGPDADLARHVARMNWLRTGLWTARLALLIATTAPSA